MKSSNPALQEGFENNYSWGRSSPKDNADSMTMFGTAWKTVLLLIVMFVPFVATYNYATTGYSEAFQQANAERAKAKEEAAKPDSKLTEKEKAALKDAVAITIPGNVYTMVIVGSLLGFGLGLFIIWNRETAPYLSFLYAVCQGVTLGGISAGFEARYPGIALQAAAITLGGLLGMLALHMTGLIKVTSWFIGAILAAMLAILAAYIIDDLMILFGGTYVSVLHQGGWWGVSIQAIIVIVAMLNFLIDFDAIENGVKNQQPKYMEWYGAFGLLVTIVWLYLEALRLLAKMKSDD